MKRWFERLLIALFVWVAASWLTCRRGVGQNPADSSITVIQAPGWPLLGQTLCNGRRMPIVILQAGLPDTVRYEVLRHEVYHIRQMAKHGGCLRASLRYGDDPDFRFKLEAEAYCDGLRWHVDNTKRTYSELFNFIVPQLYEHYGKHRKPAETIKRFTRICPEKVR